MTQSQLQCTVIAQSIWRQFRTVFCGLQKCKKAITTSHFLHNMAHTLTGKPGCYQWQQREWAMTQGLVSPTPVLACIGVAFYPDTAATVCFIHVPSSTTDNMKKELKVFDSCPWRVNFLNTFCKILLTVDWYSSATLYYS